MLSFMFNVVSKPPLCDHTANIQPKTKSHITVKESDSDTVIMVIVLVAGVGAVFILFALMALCYR